MMDTMMSVVLDVMVGSEAGAGWAGAAAAGTAAAGWSDGWGRG